MRFHKNSIITIATTSITFKYIFDEYNLVKIKPRTKIQKLNLIGVFMLDLKFFLIMNLTKINVMSILYNWVNENRNN